MNEVSSMTVSLSTSRQQQRQRLLPLLLLLLTAVRWSWLWKPQRLVQNLETTPQALRSTRIEQAHTNPQPQSSLLPSCINFCSTSTGLADQCELEPMENPSFDLP